MEIYLQYRFEEERRADFLRQAEEHRLLKQSGLTDAWQIVALPFRLLDGLIRYRRAVFYTVRTMKNANRSKFRSGMSA